MVFRIFQAAALEKSLKDSEDAKAKVAALEQNVKDLEVGLTTSGALKLVDVDVERFIEAGQGHCIQSIL